MCVLDAVTQVPSPGQAPTAPPAPVEEPIRQDPPPAEPPVEAPPARDPTPTQPPREAPPDEPPPRALRRRVG